MVGFLDAKVYGKQHAKVEKCLEIRPVPTKLGGVSIIISRELI